MNRYDSSNLFLNNGNKPQSFMKLFDGAKQKKLVETVKAIKENAVKDVG
jgi:type I restriction enzyme R subunit